MRRIGAYANRPAALLPRCLKRGRPFVRAAFLVPVPLLAETSGRTRRWH